MTPSGHPPSPAVTLRQARESEAEQLSAIAVASKGYWGYPEAWLARWRAALLISPAYIRAQPVFVAEVAGAGPVAFAALVEQPTRWDLDHLWVTPAYIGRGIGRMLFQHSVAYLRRVAPHAVLGIESEPHAEAFYLRMGCRRVATITRDWDGLPRTLPYLELALGA